jgi:hypothetical protein
MKHRATQINNIKLEISSRRLEGAQSPKAAPTLVEDLVVADHILDQHQILDGYGHFSVRLEGLGAACLRQVQWRLEPEPGGCGVSGFFVAPSTTTAGGRCRRGKTRNDLLLGLLSGLALAC